MGVDYRRTELPKSPDELDQRSQIFKRMYFAGQGGNDSYFDIWKSFGFVEQQSTRTCHEGNPEQATIEPRCNLQSDFLRPAQFELGDDMAN